MKGDEFIAEVRNLTELESNEEAEKATCATLETLKERLADDEPSNLVAQLPHEVARLVEGERAARPSPWIGSTGGSRREKV